MKFGTSHHHEILSSTKAKSLYGKFLGSVVAVAVMSAVETTTVAAVTGTAQKRSDW